MCQNAPRNVRRASPTFRLQEALLEKAQFLARTAAAIGAASLSHPALVCAAPATTLKLVPYADRALLDPNVNAFVTRNHCMTVFDTLFTLAAAGNAQPQMLAGCTTENDDKTWKLTLRDGLTFHDGTIRRV